MAAFKKKNYHNVLGIDLDEDCLNYARYIGIDVRLGSIDVLRKEELFDLIALTHVLEHFTDPLQLLLSLKKHLTKKGVIYIEVPAMEMILQGQHDYSFKSFLEAAHYTHFNEKPFSSYERAL